jgi:uncharacterized membrane protein YbhN (UPF0104 family)
MTRDTLKTLQWLAVTAILFFVGLKFAENWNEMKATQVSLHFDPALLAASAGFVLLSYVILIWTWQRTVRAWGERLEFGPAMRIWFISNLGRYLPGKVWQIGAMGVMAQRAGVSPTAAVGSSLVVSIVNVLVGIAVAFAAGAGDLGAPAWAIPLTIGAAIVVAATPWLLPVVTRLASSVLRREIKTPELPHSAIWIAAAGCAAAWILYGVAFRFLHISVLGAATGNAVHSTAAFTASYIVGFLFLFAPGGIGVREYALHQLLVRFGIAVGAEAWLVVFASRIWLTIIEVLPGLLLLLLRRESPQPSSSQAA